MKMYLKINLAVLTALFLFPSVTSFGQSQLPGTQVEMAPIPGDSIDLYFWQYIPQGYNHADTIKKYPLMIFMHGLGERAVASAQGFEELKKVRKFGPPKEILDGSNMCFRVNGVTECFFVLSPQLPNNTTTWGKEPADLVAYAVNHFNIDTNKIYITGLSLGGMGTIDYVQNNGTTIWPYTSQIAAIGVSPGGGGSTTGNDECLLPLRDIPMWDCHINGDITSGTRYTDMTNFVNAVNGCTPGAPTAFMTTLESLSDDTHNSWSRFYRTNHTYFLPNVYEWFLLNPKSANNISPFSAGAYAGKDRLTANSSVTLSGEGSDNDSGVLDGSNVSYLWTKESGGPVTFSSTTISNPVVSGLTPGVYKFRLTVTDDDNTSNYDIVTITVHNRPTASAGPDQSIMLPTNSVTLTGTGSDAEGPVTFAWTKLQGPALGTIVSPNSSGTIVNNLEVGVYVFRLTVTDKDLATRTDDVTVTVNGATQSGTKIWNSWDIVTQSNPIQQGVVTSTSGNVTAGVEFYVSDDAFGVTKVGLFPAWNGTVHNDLNARVENYWALTQATATSKVYPYAGKSTVGRGTGNEPGEANVPTPTGVYDLQLHPPIGDQQTVAAFIAPFAGTYTISNLSVRRLSTGGTTVKYKVYDKNKTLLTTLVTVDDSRAWVNSTASFSIGTLMAGDRIYFATERDGAWDYDLTEVAWSVAGTPAPQAWSSYSITTQGDVTKQGVVNSTLGTEATVEFYVSDDLFGVNKVALFPAWNGTVHNDLNARVTNYWAVTQATATSKVYPYAGKSTVGRGTNSEPGEANVPAPTGVFDLQLHPPSTDQQTVAAFIVPVEGSYVVNNLSVRKLSTGGTTVKFKVYDKNKTLLTTLVTIDDSRAWVNSPASFSLGTLLAGDKIYFATERDGAWDYDMTEVAFGISLNGGQAARAIQEIAAENVVQQDEQYQNYKIIVYNNQGQRLKEFAQTSRPSDLDLINLRSHVDKNGLYIFRIINSEKDVKTKRIMFSE
jgi:hypothetical protein